jgi:hypothetical protein
MRARLNNKGIHASYEFIRDMACLTMQPERFYTLTGASENWIVRVSYSPYNGTLTTFFTNRTDTTIQIHTRTSKNPATTCDTLANLGITSMEQLTLDK